MTQLTAWADLWLLVLSGCAAVLGWYLRTMREDLRELDRCVQNLSRTGAADLVRGAYADERLARIEGKLDAMIAQLARKVDRDELTVHPR